MRKHRLRRSKRINTDYEMRGTRYEDGFSLIEVLIAILLVGLAIASLVTANSAFTKANGAGVELSTAEFLIEQIRELSILLPVIDPETGIFTFGPEVGETLADYDDLDDFDGASFSPPIDAGREPLDDLVAYSQQITVENVNASDFEQVEIDHSSFFVRVSVKVFLNSRQISSARWLRARY
ncbi:MAG: prepilin-type N-terminal cleavage/methylation domain-containing protein [Planctomycetes bacterium]|nr:prepilin-type N-terminal cleavage/methylation domain-containing protein [Planctomycetota bacterium]